MNKEFDKILERLDKLENLFIKRNSRTCAAGVHQSKKIVQEVAEEYNGGWIPCSERLPELDGTYICTCQGIAESITLIFSTHDNSWNDEFKSEYDDVIAWQPLPLPYKELD